MSTDYYKRRKLNRQIVSWILTTFVILGSLSNEVMSFKKVYGSLDKITLRDKLIKKFVPAKENSENAIETISIKNDIVETDKYKIEKEKLSALNTNVNLIQVNIGGQCFGYVSKESEAKKLLNRVGQLYLEKKNINKDDVTEFEVDGKIELVKAYGNQSKIHSIDEIAEKILLENDDYDLVNIKMKILDEKEVVIDCDTKIIRSDELYLGEQQTEEGSDGKKKVINEISVENGDVIKENKLQENILIQPKDTVILSGVKDPIGDKVAFLNKPTRGWVVTSNFGPRWGRNHNGMDIAGNIGDPVIATFDGIVRQRFYDEGYGNVIFLQHENGIETIYGHLSGFNIEPGQAVKKGDLIGFVGNTGRSTGPHLHFELRVNGKAVDPSKYIN